MPSLRASFQSVRTRTTDLCRTLEREDYVVQSMPDVSPTKWHLAHTSWFFEQFVLKPFVGDYREFSQDYHYLFNSYYQSAGSMHPRPRRGLLSRPTVRETLAYRAYVDEAVDRLLEQDVRPDCEERIVLGLNHEQQHQELLLTDIKHVLSRHPGGAAMNEGLAMPPLRPAPPHRFVSHSGGPVQIGALGTGFAFDNETPRHEALIHDHAIGSRLVTNGEYQEFVRDGGYQTHALWLSDGWATVQSRPWTRPLYWSEDHQREYTLGGWRDLDPNAPVTHVSFYEADAFARWRGARLPTEQEWECHAVQHPVAGNLQDAGYWHPISAATDNGQWYGDAWEWTASAYAPYPGFKPLAGSLGEYNGKFMCNQMTVRGGSCVTADDHIRSSYRSFFYPDARWQFLGIRLARDGTGPA